MSWKEEFVSVFENSVAIGNVLADRIYPNIIPEGNDFPAAAFQQADISPSNHKSGPSTLDFVTVDLDIVALSYKAVDEAAEICRKELESYAGGSNIYRITFQDGTDLIDTTNKYHRINQEYLVTVKRST